MEIRRLPRPSNEVDAIDKRSCVISGLSGRRSAGSRIVEEEFDVNRYDKWLNVSAREERANERSGQGFGARTNVCRLANLASRLILSFRVGMD